MNRLISKGIVFSMASILGGVDSVQAAEFQISTPDSLFAIVTLKAGVASAFAHNHLVVAENFSEKISFDEKDLSSGTFEMTIPVNKLVIDKPEYQKRHYPSVKELSILDAPFVEISESDRTKIKGNMLEPGQLDSESYPVITAKVMGIQKSPKKIGKVEFDHSVSFSLTIKGKTVEKTIPANISYQDGILSVSVFGEYKFSEFGIKPYSAMLGAVKNKDSFFLVSQFKAKKK